VDCAANHGSLRTEKRKRSEKRETMNPETQSPRRSGTSLGAKFRARDSNWLWFCCVQI
jgi:hypothetical protein